MLAPMVLLYSLTRYASGFIRYAVPAPRNPIPLVCRSASASTAPPSRAPYLISYFTDVEGDGDYLERFVGLSRVLDRGEDGELELAPSAHLVFGGDVVDRGGEDLKVLDVVLGLKERYPDNVHLVMGNRDANKMRIGQELGNSTHLPEHQGVYWFRGSGRVGDPELNNVPRDGVGRLKFLLQATMGCPDTFEFRKEEIGGTDEDVVESFRVECAPEGRMGRYIRNAEVCVKLGPVVVTHGGIAKSPEVEDEGVCGFGAVPPSFRPVEGFAEWFEGVRGWAEKEVDDWVKGRGGGKVWATEGGYQTAECAGGNLMMFGMGWMRERGGERKKNPTVIYSSWLNDGMPYETASNEYVKDVFRKVGKEGLKIMLCGHQPHGDAPLPIRIEGGEGEEDEEGEGGGAGDFMIVTADTSYSGDVVWRGGRENRGREGSKSGRGKVAVSEILVSVGEGDTIEDVVSHGILSDGSAYESSLYKDNLVGREASVEAFGENQAFVEGGEEERSRSKWWIKASLGDGKYLACYAKGWNVSNQVVELLSNKDAQ